MGALGVRGEPVHPKTLGATLLLMRSQGLISYRVIREQPPIVEYNATPFGLQLVQLLDRFRQVIEIHRAEFPSGTSDDEDGQS